MNIIIDTNVFVAAGFNPRSSAADVINDVRQGKLRLIWDKRTKAETKKLLQQIPHINWHKFAGLFTNENRHETSAMPQEFSDLIEDRDDRKFAALAHSSGATIVTNDQDLLVANGKKSLHVITPKQLKSQKLQK